jgi:hypothetical protein
MHIDFTNPVTILSIWAMASTVLSLVNKAWLRQNMPKVANVVGAICAISPADLGTLIEEVTALMKGQPLSSVVVPVTVEPPAPATPPQAPATKR